jgi:hypothetical protein
MPCPSASPALSGCQGHCHCHWQELLDLEPRRPVRPHSVPLSDVRPPVSLELSDSDAALAAAAVRWSPHMLQPHEYSQWDSGVRSQRQ